MAGKLLILFIALPLVETWLLIKIGGIIGAVWTILAVITTAVIGSQLVRRQGLQTFAQIQACQARGEMPAVPILEGAALLLAGAFLVTPGFITDTLGFLLLVPALRQHAAKQILARVVTITPAGTPGDAYQQANRDSANLQSGNSSNIIEGEYRREE